MFRDLIAYLSDRCQPVAPDLSGLGQNLPDAKLHLPDTGHFAFEIHVEENAALMRDFLGCVLPMESGAT